MSTTTTPLQPITSVASEHDEPYFASPQGLRKLLVLLYREGPASWHTNPDVPALMRYCADKYQLLARRYEQTPEDAAEAAFEVLVTPSTIETDDPWGVVTRAVQLRLQAEDRANGLLCSVDQARRLLTAPAHDAARFSEYEHGTETVQSTVPVEVEHLAAHQALELAADVPVRRSPSGTEIEPADVRTGMLTIRELLVESGWPSDAAHVGLDYLCERLRDAGSPVSAFDSLRRDPTPLVLLGLDQGSWTKLCQLLLGQPGQLGLLARAVLGERPADLARDEAVVRRLASTAPRQVVRHG